MSYESSTLHPHIVRFFDSIRPWQHAYCYSNFSFVALRHEDELVIVAARLRLRAKEHQQELRPEFRSASIRAGEVPLTGSPEAIADWVTTAVSGHQLAVGGHVLTLLQDPATGYSAFHDHPDSTFQPWNPSYVDRLVVSGASRWNFLSPKELELEKELQPYGFRSIRDFMREYGFDLSASDMLSLEIVAEPVARFDAKSLLRGGKARAFMSLALPLSPEEFTLIAVDTETNGGLFRRRLSSGEISWARSPSDWNGECTVDIPDKATITCRAVYGGSLHDETRLVDSDAFPNFRRTLVELADPGLQRLQGPLANPKSKQEQNDFEAGVCVLLYMLGFDSVRVGGVKKLSDAADIFSTTPSGETLVVECTTEVLDPRGKLNNLIERVDQARQKLCRGSGGLTPDRIVGVIVIPKMRSELSSDFKVAEKHGILVLCRTEIEEAIERTRLTPNADATLRHWRERQLRELLSHGFGDLT